MIWINIICLGFTTINFQQKYAKSFSETTILYLLAYFIYKLMQIINEKKSIIFGHIKILFYICNTPSVLLINNYVFKC